MQNLINRSQKYMNQKKTVLLHFCFVVVLILFSSICSFSQTSFDKAAYFEVLNHGKLSTIDNQLKLIKDLSGSEKDAFEGAMMMKKASKVAIPAQKLSIFKKGHQKLESAISKNSTKVAYRFLRLMIQENAPKNLGYHKNINEDVKLIIEGKNSVSKDIQNAIEDYSKISKKI